MRMSPRWSTSLPNDSCSILMLSPLNIKKMPKSSPIKEWILGGVEGLSLGLRVGVVVEVGSVSSVPVLSFFYLIRGL